MVFVYPNSISTFRGKRETAIQFGYEEITDEIYADLCDSKKIWQDGQIVDNPDYLTMKAEEENRQRRQETITSIKNELSEIKKWFADTDYYVNKIVTGEWATSDYRWINYLAERNIKRARQDELNTQLQNLT